MSAITGVAAIGVWLALAPQSGPAPERIYGRVLTTAGEELEGYLRWDHNETHWSDLLDGRAFISREHEAEAERLDDELRQRRTLERSVSLPGLRITWDEDDDRPLEPTSAAVRFGHVRALEPMDRRALVTLESGEEIELASSSSDLGRSFRGVVVESAGSGEREIEWEDLARVDFMPAPPGHAPPISRRLHGTLRTRDGSTWTGLVAWSLDESLASDTLDGEREDDRMTKVPFGDIVSIERESRRSARVRLRNGEQLVLMDTNDVGSDIRGIEITDPSFGKVVVGWDAFRSLELHPPTEAAPGKGAYAGGRRLRGTVVAEDGRHVEGLIRWDNDEDRTWDMLYARSGDVDITIELGLVRSIARVGATSRVTLHGGRTFSLEGTEELGDLGESNRGIFVTPENGDTTLVRWRDLVSATFDPVER
ncbi:MAG: hypothetical protein AB7T31_15365 [Gemmatimonadales bacterium]